MYRDIVRPKWLTMATKRLRTQPRVVSSTSSSLYKPASIIERLREQTELCKLSNGKV